MFAFLDTAYLKKQTYQVALTSNQEILQISYKIVVLMLMKIWKCKLLIIACLEQISNSLNVTTQINLEKLKWDHCIVKHLDLKDINLLNTQWKKMVFLSSMYLFSNSTYTRFPSQMSYFQTIHELEKNFWRIFHSWNSPISPIFNGSFIQI